MKITCEDNMELMSRYPDGYFDLAIVDPPYVININAYMVLNIGHKKKNDIVNWNSVIPIDEYIIEMFISSNH